MGNDYMADAKGPHVLVRFKSRQAFQHPHTQQRVCRLKGDQDVLPRGFASEFESCNMVEVLGPVSNIPQVGSLIEEVEDAASI